MNHESVALLMALLQFVVAGFGVFLSRQCALSPWLASCASIFIVSANVATWF